MKEFCNEAYFMIFATLSNRTRLAMIDVLKEGPKNAAEIAGSLEQEESAVSQHLALLARYGIVLVEVSGNSKSYSLNKEIIGPLSGLLSFHVDKYCPGSNECIPPEKLREYMKAEAAKTTYIEHE